MYQVPVFGRRVLETRSQAQTCGGDGVDFLVVSVRLVHGEVGQARDSVDHRADGEVLCLLITCRLGIRRIWVMVSDQAREGVDAIWAEGFDRRRPQYIVEDGGQQVCCGHEAVCHAAMQWRERRRGRKVKEEVRYLMVGCG